MTVADVVAADKDDNEADDVFSWLRVIIVLFWLFEFGCEVLLVACLLIVIVFSIDDFPRLRLSDDLDEAASSPPLHFLAFMLF